MICRDCQAKMTGAAMCHCADCHATFGSVRGFDRHRTGPISARYCLPPEDVRDGKDKRLVLRDGIWKWDDPDGRSGSAYGRRSAENPVRVPDSTPPPDTPSLSTVSP